MTPKTLLKAVQNIQGGSFIGLDTLTQVKLKGGAKNPMQGRVTKQMMGATVMAFQNKEVNGYDAMVRRRLEAEGRSANDFVIGPRAWGTRIPNLPVVVHNKDGQDKYYLEVIFLRPGTVTYLLDGKPIAKGDIEGLVEPKIDPDAQGGLENRVIVRDFGAESIVELRIDGKNFN